ncbi:MAG TPA: hypothetical protein VN689_08925, partial [Burkholderiales bacterium]|nr:hypothetical protein [Burkholderiales bacterium]
GVIDRARLCPGPNVRHERITFRFVISCKSGVPMPNRSNETPQAKKERLSIEGAQAMKEYVAGAEATNVRTARLRAERLAREAEAAEARGSTARRGAKSAG